MQSFDDDNYLTNSFLIAMPTLADPNFFQSVVLICQHSEEGAMGITINRPTDISLREILIHLEILNKNKQTEKNLSAIPIYIGGPLQRERGFVVHESRFDMTFENSAIISESMTITSSKDILQAIADDKGPEKTFAALGYSAWAPGQLEEELANNSWLSAPVTDEILFNTKDEDKWRAAAEMIGVDINLLSSETGHG